MRADLQNLDFTLQKMIFSPQIGAKVQCGTANLVVVPFSPQPYINHAELAEYGISPDDGPALMRAVKLAFSMGLIGSDIAPIRVGNAFELLKDLPQQKLPRIGTGIVLSMGVARLNDLDRRQWRACGYQSQGEFLDYWARTMPEAPADTNPWCWLIHFEYKG